MYSQGSWGNRHGRWWGQRLLSKKGMAQKALWTAVLLEAAVSKERAAKKKKKKGQREKGKRKGNERKRKERKKTILPAKSLCLRQPQFLTSSRGLFRVKWPSQGCHFQLLKKQAELLALSSTWPKGWWAEEEERESTSSPVAGVCTQQGW